MPSQSVHLILMYSSQILHVPLGPVMIYGLESSNSSLGSWVFQQCCFVKVQGFQNSWQVFSVRYFGNVELGPVHMEMFRTSWEVQLQSVAVAQADCEQGLLFGCLTTADSKWI